MHAMAGKMRDPVASFGIEASMAIARVIRGEMEKSGLGAADLASVLDLQPQHVHAYLQLDPEKRKRWGRNFQNSQVERIAKRLGTTRERILTLAGVPVPKQGNGGEERLFPELEAVIQEYESLLLVADANTARTAARALFATGAWQPKREACVKLVESVLEGKQPKG